MTASVVAAYSATGAAWQAGPELVYDRLGRDLVGRSPVSWAGRRVLDLGAGTGAASRALAAAGAAPIALDAAFGMLAVDRPARPPAVVGDAYALPLADASVDGVVAAYSINHLAMPEAGLVECRRVARPGSPVLVSSYASDDDHPVKAVVDRVARAAGWEPPPWYSRLRADVFPRLATVDRAAAVCRQAGLAAEVDLVEIPFPELGPDALVAWRFGMAHLAPFMAGQRPAERHALAAAARDQLGDAGQLVRRVVVIVAVV